jgi:hypothetical protein
MLKNLFKFQIFLSLLSLFACSDKKTSGVSVEDNAFAGVESSSSESFSNNSESSSSETEDVVVVNKENLWSGPAGEYKVNTESENAGYWFSWGDGVSGGSSQILYPIPMENEYSESSLKPVIDYCEGLCGTIAFGNDSNPEAGVGFYVADEGETVDISSWGGICVTYASDVGFNVYILSRIGDKSDVDLFPRYYMQGSISDKALVTLNPLDSMSIMTSCAKWSDFSNGSEDPSSMRLGDEDAKKANAIIFKFNGSPGATNSFNIKSIGTYGERLAQEL